MNVNNEIVGNLAIGGHSTTGGNATVRGRMLVGGDVRIDGWLDAPNIKDVNKGLFTSEEALNAAYPRPKAGWFALVGNTLPAELYVVKDGQWTDTFSQAGELIGSLDPFNERLDDVFVWRTQVNTYIKNLDTDASNLRSGLSNESQKREQAITNLAETLNKAISIEKSSREQGMAGASQTIALTKSELAEAIDTESSQRKTDDITLQTLINEANQQIADIADEIVKLHSSASIKFSPSIINKTSEASDYIITANADYQGKAPLCITIQQLVNENWEDIVSAKYVTTLSIDAILCPDADAFRVKADITDKVTIYSDECMVEAYSPIYMFFAPSYLNNETDFVEHADEYMTKGNALPPTAAAAGIYKCTSNADEQRLFICIPEDVDGVSSFTMGDVTFGMTRLCMCGECPCYTVYSSIGVYDNGTQIKLTARQDKNGYSESKDRTSSDKRSKQSRCCCC